MPFSPHRARRLCGRYLWENGLKSELIRRLLCHTSIGTTMIYIKPEVAGAPSKVQKYVKKFYFVRSLDMRLLS
ncbi:tyrosine-type recombinase/integrase [Thermoplasma volcanium]|uniref:tyrosine-type recombinase/integrase n=1 Tax=Thermoplasma volcanium TaxID=50339 RepID=UPI000A01C055